MTGVRRAAELGEQPRLILAAERARLRDRGVPGELLLVGGEGAYEERKSAFFDRLVRLWPAHPVSALEKGDGAGGRL